jgi:hypothetical protein
MQRPLFLHNEALFSNAIFPLSILPKDAADFRLLFVKARVIVPEVRLAQSFKPIWLEIANNQT